MVRGLKRVDKAFVLTMAAYNRDAYEVLGTGPSGGGILPGKQSETDHSPPTTPLKHVSIALSEKHRKTTPAGVAINFVGG